MFILSFQILRQSAVYGHFLDITDG